MVTSLLTSLPEPGLRQSHIALGVQKKTWFQRDKFSTRSHCEYSCLVHVIAWCNHQIPLGPGHSTFDTLGWDFWSESGIWTCPISMWEGFSWSSWALHVGTTHHTLPAPWLPKRVYTHHTMGPRKCAVNVTGWTIMWDHMSPDSRRLT